MAMIWNFSTDFLPFRDQGDPTFDDYYQQKKSEQKPEEDRFCFSKSFYKQVCSNWLGCCFKV